MNKKIEELKECDLCSANLTRYGKTIAQGEFSQSGIVTDIHIDMCMKCKYIFQREKFNSDTLSILYKDDAGCWDSDFEGKSEKFKLFMLKRQKFLIKALEISGFLSRKGLTILDVGGGVGEATSHLTSYGKVFIVDVNTSDLCNNKLVKIDGLFDEVIFHNKFDLIVMNHVMEHVFSPTIYLEKAYENLKDDGVLVVEVPFELYTPLLFGRTGDWRHVCYFSTNVLRNFIRKAGFQEIYLKLTTGHYEERRIAVIRVIAKKKNIDKRVTIKTQSILPLIWDCLHVRAITAYITSQIRKIST